MAGNHFPSPDLSPECLIHKYGWCFPHQPLRLHIFKLNSYSPHIQICTICSVGMSTLTLLSPSSHKSTQSSNPVGCLCSPFTLLSPCSTSDPGYLDGFNLCPTLRSQGHKHSPCTSLVSSVQWKQQAIEGWPCGYGSLSVDWLGLLWRTGRAPEPWKFCPTSGRSSTITCLCHEVLPPMIVFPYLVKNVALSSFSTYPIIPWS